MLLLESDRSSGPGYSYDAATDSFVARHEFDDYHSSGSSAVSRDGQQFAVEHEFNDTVWITSNTFAPITTLSSIAGGCIFDPNYDLFYGLDATHDEIVVFSTDTWTTIGHIAAGLDLRTTSSFNGGVVSFNPFNKELYVSVNEGILAIVVVPEPSTLLLGALAGLGLLLRRRAFRW
jgi:hypothetical protein